MSLLSFLSCWTLLLSLSPFEWSSSSFWLLMLHSIELEIEDCAGSSNFGSFCSAFTASVDFYPKMNDQERGKSWSWSVTDFTPSPLLFSHLKLRGVFFLSWKSRQNCNLVSASSSFPSFIHPLEAVCFHASLIPDCLSAWLPLLFLSFDWHRDVTRDGK